MKLYLISQHKNTAYDTYDSAVVVAHSEDDARNTHPSFDNRKGPQKYDIDTWTKPEHVFVDEIGDAAPHMLRGVVCASFNAG